MFIYLENAPVKYAYFYYFTPGRCFWSAAAQISDICTHYGGDAENLLSAIQAVTAGN